MKLEFHSAMRLLAAKDKLNAVLEVIEKGETLCDVAARYGCSRQSLAAWVKKYKNGTTNKSNETNRSNLGILGLAYRRGANHPKSLSPRIEKQVLDLVIKKPELNIYKLADELKARGVNISASGVYKILVRHNLQVKELRVAFSFSHPAGTVYASRITPVTRKKFIEEYLFGKFSISQICRRWSVSRRTFYEWLKRYQEAAGVKDSLTPGKSGPTPRVFTSVVEALAKRYKRGVLHHNSIGEAAREQILEIVRANPYFSVHRIYAELLREGAAIGHAAIQNLLRREGLNTLYRRREYAEGYITEPQVEVAPQYVPEIPIYKWRQLFAPFVTIPKLLVTNPRQGLQLLAFSLLPIFAIVIFFRSVFGGAPRTSAVGLIFASVALFFGIFFFIYSLKYYISIFMVLKLAQSGSGSQTIDN